MRWKLAFGLASDDLFFVTSKPEEFGPPGTPVRSKVTTFLDEDEFLVHLMSAGLRDDRTMAIASAVLLSVASPASPPPWIDVDLTQRQMELLHLDGATSAETARPAKTVSIRKRRGPAVGRSFTTC